VGSGQWGASSEPCTSEKKIQMRRKGEERGRGEDIRARSTHVVHVYVSMCFVALRCATSRCTALCSAVVLGHATHGLLACQASWIGGGLGGWNWRQSLHASVCADRRSQSRLYVYCLINEFTLNSTASRSRPPSLAPGAGLCQNWGPKAPHLFSGRHSAF
jgi:hypothetical protein